MDFVIETLRTDWEAMLRFAPRLFYGLVLLLFFLVAGRLGGNVVARVLRRTGRFRANEAFFRHLFTWAVGVIGFLLALGIMGFQGVAASLLATGGVVAVVLGFAFREIGENFLAGFFLSFSRPFEVDDLIKTGDLTGEVKSIELRYVHIRAFDACDVFIPSAQIFREPLHNYTRDGLRRPSFTVGVAYHDDPKTVVDLLERVTAGVKDVLQKPRAFVSIKEFAEQYVEYEVFFWLDVNKSERGFIGVRNDVKIACWQALREAGMTFSTDVTAGIEIKSTPALQVAVSQAE
ncbi:MAG: mechanosensitive ion channel family protein [Gammaproteobacteria bacterium]|nr:mechanosensitive ion channel family protein [Gammaproteobacteria bacterium]MDH3506824.1 mechanosensitive ion channel family protein [Gammaproteobacteria bacterium]